MSAVLHSAGSHMRLSTFYRTARTMSSSVQAAQVPVLPLKPPSLDEENSQFEARTSEMSSFFSLPRFSSLKRPYAPEAVASKQGSLPVLPLPSTLLADKLYGVLSKAAAEGKPVHTMGAIDPVQMTQMARHQEVVYISGWAASSVLTTGNNDVGPDLGCASLLFCAAVSNQNVSDYPYTTVPNQVHRIFRAQQLHDKKHYDERMTATPAQREKMEHIDYLRPIIADADTG